MSPTAERATRISVAERYQANIAAIETYKALQAENREATTAEKQSMAAYSGWGAAGLSNIFDETNRESEPERYELKELLTEDEYRAAARGTNYAHYTDPAYVTSIWSALKEYGFESGQVLEPGSGIGNFIGLAPTGAQLTGVEIDPIAAQLSQAIYPNATIREESFAISPFSTGYFDAAIGNVPFSQVKLHDPRHNSGQHSMHNHFIIKSLGLTKPGGLVAVITSTSTLDAQGTAARQEMFEKADLLGAYRLPEGAFNNAGTQVMTDLLVFRVREEGKEPLSNDWVISSERTHQSNEQTYYRNNYFDTHPQNILGDTRITTNRFGVLTESVTTDQYGHENLPRILARALIQDAATAKAAGYTYSPVETNAAVAPLIVPDNRMVDGYLIDQGNGQFKVYRSYQGLEDFPVASTRRQELSHLLELREQTRALLYAEAATERDTPQIRDARAALRANYESYVETYGPINRVTTHTTQDGGVRYKRALVMEQFDQDPYQGLVKGLEIYSQATGVAVPAKILTQRVLEARKPVTEVDNVADALTISLDQRGSVDPQFMGRLTKRSPEEVITQLESKIFVLPHLPGQDPTYVTREEYLSGNVRQKLEEATRYAEANPAMTANVEALRSVIPEDIPASDIKVNLGAAWISDTYHEQFAREVLGVSNAKIARIYGSEWSIEGATWRDPHNMGTDRRSPIELLSSIINNQQINITTNKEFDAAATAIAQQKADAISEKFEDWIWSDRERAAELVKTYNEVNNSLVLRDYTEAGQGLTLPGLVTSFQPHPHQLTAVARMIHEPSVGLFHGVGAGKTAEMVMGTTELKRLGLINKPAVVVPNHMLEQFAKEWLSLYPQAKVLAASSSDIGSGDKRQAFLGRVATNDWDAVILTHDSLVKLELSPESQASYLDREVQVMRDGLEKYQAQAGDSYDKKTVKDIEKKIEIREQKITALLDAPRDLGLTFEQTGIDYLCVDELHEFKNLATSSNIQGASITGSQKATHLHSLVEYLRETNGNRVMTGATGTPIANSITEMHVMSRYLAPELLRERGLEDFDSWASTFGQTVSEMELTVAGGDSYKMKTRFSQFTNVPELTQLFHTYGDVKLASEFEGINLPQVRERADGKRAPQILLLERSEAQSAYIKTLGERYDNLGGGRPQKGEDSPLVIASDGRKAAADMRFIDPSYVPSPLEENKAARTADLLAEVYEEYKDHIYMIPKTGVEHSVPGALQMVFCDYGVPGNANKEFDLYNELKNQAVARGIPAEKIRFISEAKTDAQKERLYEQCRNGEVAVLIGSTKKMGTGTNVQDRLVHLVHLDAPWRPADVEQRNGRIIRQGNQNSEVRITQVVTEGTFDANMWATLDRKQKFIAQIMSPKPGARTVEELGTAQPTYAEVQAVATGNPFIIEHHTAAEKVKSLEAAYRGYNRNRDNQLFTLEALTARNESLEKQIQQVKEHASGYFSTAGDNFSMEVAGRSFDKRMDAVEAMQVWAKEHVPMRPSYLRETDLGVIGQLGGARWNVALGKAKASQIGETPVTISIASMPWIKVEANYAEVSKPTRGLLTRMENLVGNSAGWLERMEAEYAGNSGEIEQLRTKVDQPFEKLGQLETARAEETRLGALVQRFKAAKTKEEKEAIMAAADQQGLDIVGTYEQKPVEAQEQGDKQQEVTTVEQLQQQRQERIQILRNQVEKDYEPVNAAKEKVEVGQSTRERMLARGEVSEAMRNFKEKYPGAEGPKQAIEQVCKTDARTIELEEQIKEQSGKSGVELEREQQLIPLERQLKTLNEQKQSGLDELKEARDTVAQATVELDKAQSAELDLEARQRDYQLRLVKPIADEYALIEQARREESAGSDWWGISKKGEAQQRLDEFSAKYGGAQNMSDINFQWVPKDAGVKDFEQQRKKAAEETDQARGKLQRAYDAETVQMKKVREAQQGIVQLQVRREQVDPAVKAARIRQTGVSGPSARSGGVVERQRGLER